MLWLGKCEKSHIFPCKNVIIPTFKCGLEANAEEDLGLLGGHQEGVAGVEEEGEVGFDVGMGEEGAVVIGESDAPVDSGGHLLRKVLAVAFNNRAAIAEALQNGYVE